MADHDEDLFRRAMSDVSPIKQTGTESIITKPEPRALLRRRDEATVLEESLQDNPERSDLESDDEMTFRRDNVSPVTVRRLRRGRFRIDQEIDLHGLTRAEARATLLEFIAEESQHGSRCVRVIHGKGLRSGHRGPVLKQSVNRWLRRLDNVLAFTPARRVDGGSGALYVLLRA